MDGIMHRIMRAVGRVTTSWAERVAEHVLLFGVDPDAADKSRRVAPEGAAPVRNPCGLRSEPVIPSSACHRARLHSL